MGFDFIAAALFGFLGAACHQMWSRAGPLLQVFFALLWFGLVAASQPLFVERLIGGYPGDSFHTLGMPQAAGLVLLSAAMTAGILLVAKSAAESFQYYLREPVASLVILPFALLLFLIWDFLAPQIYYGYYLVIFDGLPLQWVLHPDKILERLIAFMTPGPAVSLANDTAALMLHTLLLLGAARIVAGTARARFVPLMLTLALARFALLKLAGL